MTRRSRILGIVLLLAAGLIAGTLFAPGPSAPNGQTDTAVVLHSGGGLRGVAADLHRAGVIRSRSVFLAAAVLTGAARGLKAGEYAVPSQASLAQILGLIRSGKVVRHFVTIPEGLTARQAARILRAADVLQGDTPSIAEGSILPETYEVRRGETRADVVRRMAAARDVLVQSLWSGRDPALPFRSPEQAVALASIVEKETGKAAERPHIAAVFLNRLRMGMRLQSDPTVIYAVSGGDPLGRGLRASELALASPYNTYKVAGLPPGPIANPGKAALQAVFEPLRSDDLYFVADGTGGHAFAASLEAHNRNVARWRQIERGRAAASGATP